MDDEKPSLSDRVGRHIGLIGILALLAWFAMLWFMFGDVL